MSVRSVFYCDQCGDLILPDECYAEGGFTLFGEGGPHIMHRDCVDLWIEDEDRSNFWFDYHTPKEVERWVKGLEDARFGSR